MSGHDRDELSDGFPLQADRTLLFNLEPFGLGRPEVEGIASYIVRLAREHQIPVRRLVSRLLVPSSGRAITCDAKFFRTYASTMHGVGDYAELFVQLLGEACGRADLEQLTLRPWRFLLPSNGSALVSGQRRWCSQCLAEDPVNKTYWRLVWSISNYRVCERHSASLSQQCAACGKPQPVIPRVAVLDRCEHCCAFLGTNVVGSGSSSTTSDYLARAGRVGQIVAMGGSVQVERAHGSWIRAITERLVQLAIDRAGGCRRSGLNQRAMNAWFARADRVSMTSLLKVAAGLDIDLGKAFGGDGATPASLRRRGSAASAPSSRTRHGVEVRAAAKAQLEAAIDGRDARSLEELAATIGASRAYLSYWFPEHVKLLRSLREQQAVQAREIRRTEKRDHVRDAVQAVVANGQFPGRKRVESALRLRRLSLLERDNYETFVAAAAQHR